ncbi:LPXTG cell wall anchor domain-containing protein [Bombilactobacillus bombi]|uniref:LPXTG cell wall anchor domain-containing protein n=1 Tax=Bombilactobacillus bombi TaxID=1303590 RepID=UPI0015E5ABE3|nr:LPXTG cell wall anchor domain-containing protein [Bombilactobacillus bombi]MBA1393506.1 LPXTG cell wall anchor domain-containing protein [Lactobacillus sp. XV13L]MBA1434453.1 LPXTG cell wall anchor domain-containing protein [Bombilactobacillus bombi]
MKYRKNNNFKRLTFGKVAGIVVALFVVVGIVIGIHTTLTWAGTGYDYQGNEISKALPVAANKGENSTEGQATAQSDAHVLVADNVKPTSNAPVKTNTPGAVTVVENTNYPNTGDEVSYSSIVLGLMMLLGLLAVYRKRLIALFLKFSHR